MRSNPEIGRVQKYHRREFLKKAGQAAVVGVGLAAGVVGFSELATRTNEGPRNLTGEPLEGKGEAKYMTVGYGNKIPFRDELDLSGSEIGTLIEGQIIELQPVLGPVFASSPEDLGKFEYQGNVYGFWGKVDEARMLTSDKEGNVLETVSPGYVAGNFIRRATEEEVQTLSDAHK